MAIELLDSRRLTGPSLLLDRPGAILDVQCADEDTGRLVEAWREAVRRALAAVGWAGEELAVRTFEGGASLATTAPLDALYAATEVNEWALGAARAALAGEAPPDLEEAAARLRGEIDEERNPALLRLIDAASKRGVQILWDPDEVSIGLGRGSNTWPVGDLPEPEAVDWTGAHDVPVALVTGTNGKSTTVRLIASMVEAAGKVPGSSSTDGVVVGGETALAGDYSGPEGARRVLRDPRVDVAVLETARGGLLRRGLAVARADAALVTNVAEDHLGEWGVGDVETLARAKLTVARAVGPDGVLALNAEDPMLVRLAKELDAPLSWFALDRVPEGGEAAWLDGDVLVQTRGGERREIVRVDEVPIAMGGAARYNVANALAALLVATRLGIDADAIAEGLRRFAGSPEENPGRGNVFDLGGVTAIVDFAHNPHGYAALLDTAWALPARRRLVVLGQAGDRSDGSIRELAQLTWRVRPDRIVLKEMLEDLRGREPGEVPGIIEDELRGLGAGSGTVVRADSEIEAVRAALRWAEPGDVLLLLSHIERDAVLDLLERLDRGEWAPGEPIPD